MKNIWRLKFFFITLHPELERAVLCYETAKSISYILKLNFRET